MRFVHQLSDGPAGVVLLGGKGNALAAVTRAGKRVPGGFVLTTEGTKLLAGDGPWPPELDRDFIEAFMTLTGGNGHSVAVRSSATSEDAADASFAGQHQTVLDVQGIDAARQAVMECLASLNAESAAAYRDLTMAEGGSDAAMAVVVQLMVDATAAGVAFTDDPTGRAPGKVVVEAVAGSGELLVSGLAQAEHLVVSREGELISRETPEATVLSSEQAVEVARLAVECAELFGSEQDIEYAFDQDGVLWLLQSRPITTFAGAATTAGWKSEFDTETTDDEMWTSANIQEVLPGLLTPLSMSTARRSSQRAFVDGYKRLNLIAKNEDPPWIGLFYNRAYLNVGTTRMLAARAVGGSGDEVEKQYLGGEASSGLETETLRQRLPFMLRSTGPLLKLLATSRARTERYQREVLRAERERLTRPLGEISNAELKALILEGEEISGRVFAHHLQVSGLASVAYTNLERVLVSRVGKDRARDSLPTLLTGLKNVESAKIGIDIWNLSRVALHTGVGARMKDATFDPRAADLPPEWTAAYRSFMRAHGHRGMREMEASTRTWRHDPSTVMATVRGYLDQDEERSPLATLEKQEQERLALTVELRRDVGRLVRPLFNWFLRDAQDLVAQRERTKSIIVRAARMSDEITLEIARRLLSRDIIEREDDVYFLTFEEHLGFLQGEHDGAGWRTTVARRRREMERNRYVELPEKFLGHPVPLPPAAAEGGTVLTGLAVSAGSVTARARVIRDPAVDDPIQPGEVLVAPVTDAGWTPLFGLASGLVVDIGSALSHGSTIAREYGLPAVVNVHSGTRTIRTGDLVHIDGAAGTVTIVERAAG